MICILNHRVKINFMDYNTQIIPPQYTFVSVNKCQYDGNTYDKDDICISYSYYKNPYGPHGIFVYHKKHADKVEYSKIYELSTKYALPCEWAYGLPLARGYNVAQIRLSRNYAVGKPVILGINDDGSSTHFLWEDLRDDVKENIRADIAKREWPTLYPEELKKYFSDIKK